MASTNVVTFHAKEAFYVRRKDIPHQVYKKIVQDYSFHFFSERACNDCELKEHRLKSETKLTPTCEECAAYLGGAVMAYDEKVKGVTYLKTPIGNHVPLKKHLAKAGIKYTVKRHHRDNPMKRKIRFTGTYRDKYQEEVVETIIEKKRGIIKSPPRSGKTVMGSAAVCKIGQKTLILASQREWLLGFQETFIGSKTQPALTNCRPSQIGICKTLADFESKDVCLATVQTFYNENGKRLLNKIKSKFGVVMIDEIQTGNAAEYAKVIAVLNAKVMIGLSGTPERKDQRDIIAEQLVGPILYEAKVEQLKGEVRLVRTEYSANTKGQQIWARMVGNLEKNPQRLKLIAKWAIKDAEAGHMILIPFTQVTPIKALVKAINMMAGKQIARPFYGGLKKPDRDKYIQAARNYKIKILVGNMRLLSTGTNIPRASCLYEVTLSSNIPQATQRFARILTPYEDKPRPLYRLFLDETSVRKRCMQNEFWKCLMPRFKPVIKDQDMTILKDYLSGKEEKIHRSL